MDIYEIINRMRTERKQIEDFNLRVTYYARVSTTRDEQTMSIENQESHFREMIRRNTNWQYVEGYADRIRGENAENRVQFQRMIQDAYDGKFDLILTKEVSRFARNTIDSLTYTRDLLKHGVGVFFMTDNICTIEPDSELRLTIMSSIAQDEVRKLSERVKFGHRKAIENGHVIGNSLIFGYDKDHSKLVINEKEAEMVKLIYETYATGNYGLRDIEKLLWDKGYRSRAGKLIHHNTIGGIIQNPKYKGYYCGNKVKITDYRTKQQKFLPPEEWVMFKDETGDTVPAIVSEELWDKANEIFAERSMKVKATDRSAKKTSPLSGKIICGVHNVPFWRTSYSKELHRDEPIYEWICREKKKGKASDCPTVAIYEKELYRILSDVFIDLAENIDSYIEQFISMYENEDSDKTADRAIDDLQREIAALEAKKDKLLDLYTEDAITKTEFKSRNDKLSGEITRLKTRMTDMRRNTMSRSDTVKNVRGIKKAFAEGLKTENGVLDRQTVNDLSDLLIDEIVVTPEESSATRLEIRLKLGMIEKREYEGARPRSGIIMKKMIESYQNSAK